MLRTLKAKILEKNLDLTVMAETLGIKKDTFSRKLSEDISISLSECWQIKDAFFPDLSLDYLFRQSS